MVMQVKVGCIGALGIPLIKENVLNKLDFSREYMKQNCLNTLANLLMQECIGS